MEGAINRTDNAAKIGRSMPKTRDMGRTEEKKQEYA